MKLQTHIDMIWDVSAQDFIFTTAEHQMVLVSEVELYYQDAVMASFSYFVVKSSLVSHVSTCPVYVLTHIYGKACS